MSVAMRLTMTQRARENVQHSIASIPAVADSHQRRSVYDLPFDELERWMTADGLSPTHTRTLWKALHRESANTLLERRDFLPPLRRWIERHFADGGNLRIEIPEATADIASSDGLTRKFLLRLADGQTIETVLMGFTGRHTACVSTQAGCAMCCSPITA